MQQVMHLRNVFRADSGQAQVSKVGQGHRDDRDFGTSLFGENEMPDAAVRPGWQTDNPLLLPNQYIDGPRYCDLVGMAQPAQTRLRQHAMAIKLCSDAPRLVGQATQMLDGLSRHIRPGPGGGFQGNETVLG